MCPRMRSLFDGQYAIALTLHSKHNDTPNHETEVASTKTPAVCHRLRAFSLCPEGVEPPIFGSTIRRDRVSTNTHHANYERYLRCGSSGGSRSPKNERGDVVDGRACKANGWNAGVSLRSREIDSKNGLRRGCERGNNWTRVVVVGVTLPDFEVGWLWRLDRRFRLAGSLCCFVATTDIHCECSLKNGGRHDARRVVMVDPRVCRAADVFQPPAPSSPSRSHVGSPTMSAGVFGCTSRTDIRRWC